MQNSVSSSVGKGVHKCEIFIDRIKLGKRILRGIK
jgi:hypothetical protein